MQDRQVPSIQGYDLERLRICVMDTTVIVAIIGGCVTVLVAIAGLIKSSTTAKDLEKLKYSLEQESKKIAAQDEALGNSIKALNESLTSIQIFKDQLLIIIDSDGVFLDATSTIENICKARESLVSTYAKVMTGMDEKEEKVFHRVKNLTMVIEKFLTKSLGGLKFTSEMSTTDFSDLKNYRAGLTELQNTLRDFRIEKLSERTG